MLIARVIKNKLNGFSCPKICLLIEKWFVKILMCCVKSVDMMMAQGLALCFGKLEKDFAYENYLVI